MHRLLIRNIHTLVTMGEDERIVHGVDVLVEDGRIVAIGKNLAAYPGQSRPQAADVRTLDATNCVV